MLAAIIIVVIVCTAHPTNYMVLKASTISLVNNEYHKVLHKYKGRYSVLGYN